MKTRVAIIGTLGIPAKYGGFETLAEHLVRFKTNSYTYLVFCASSAYGKTAPKIYMGALLVHLPLRAQGVQSILYDIVSIFMALRKCDILLILGTSGCIVLPFVKLISRKQIIVNIDGLEHRREKWSYFTRMFLKFSEWIAVKFADSVISDNKVIQQYVLTQYSTTSELIEYGGDNIANWQPFDERASLPDEKLPRHYFFKVCRIEPENNVETILKAFTNLASANLVIVGNWNSSSYGRRLRKVYGSCLNIFLKDPIYDATRLNKLRINCSWYVHGHSAGGTNPSLVEAMYLKLNILAFDVPFNQETTEGKALYFKTQEHLEKIVRDISAGLVDPNGDEMMEIATRRYRWEIISKKYLQVFDDLLQTREGR